MIKMGRSLEEVMYKSYCKNPSAAKIYATGLSVMCSNSFNWGPEGIPKGVHDDSDILMKEIKSWKAFQKK